jgi:DNA-binding XRE family transcriptional regulator
MKLHRWEDLMRKRYSPEQIEAKREKAQKELLEVDLRELRELAGKTQAELAQITEMEQAAISRTEKAEDHRLSTLRRIVEALGGQLEVVAVFDNKRLRLRGI